MFYAPVMCKGQDSVVSIAMHYRLDSLGIESWWGRDFPHLFILTLGPTHLPL
jgi:hypothetical protein